MDKPVDEKEELILKVYRINYRMECTVEATSEDEAMDRYGDGEGEDHDYVEFLSIEEKFCESTLNLIRSQQPK